MVEEEEVSPLCARSPILHLSGHAAPRLSYRILQKKVRRQGGGSRGRKRVAGMRMRGSERRRLLEGGGGWGCKKRNIDYTLENFMAYRMNGSSVCRSLKERSTQVGRRSRRGRETEAGQMKQRRRRRRRRRRRKYQPASALLRFRESQHLLTSLRCAPEERNQKSSP